MDDDDDYRNTQRLRHETFGAAVCEHLADTYLSNHNDAVDHKEYDQGVMDSSSSKSPEPYARIDRTSFFRKADGLQLRGYEET